MSAVEKLRNKQEKNKSLICLGLDLDPKRMPADYAKSIKGMYEFTMRIVEATSDLVCAYKPNMAFFENRGPEGLSLLRSIIERMPEDMPVIIDGKRGDIGNTASFYAEALYDKLKADWVTLNPYMGYDSMRPFLEYKDKGVFVLCLTSNPGSKDFQHLNVDGKPLYKVVAEKVDYWNKDGNLGLVVGATQPEELRDIRAVAGDMPILIPGVGAQGGSLEKAVMFGTNNFRKMALINVSRSVLYASKEMDFAQRARQELRKLNDTVSRVRSGEIQVDLDSRFEGPEMVESQQNLPPVPPQESLKQESKPFQMPPVPDLPFVKKPVPPEPTPAPDAVPPVEPKVTVSETAAATPVDSRPVQPVVVLPVPTPSESTPVEVVSSERQTSAPEPSDQSRTEQTALPESPKEPNQPPSAPPDTAPPQQRPPAQQGGQQPPSQQAQQDRSQRRFDRRHRRDRRQRNNRFRDNRDNRPENPDQPKPWERSS